MSDLWIDKNDIDPIFDSVSPESAATAILNMDEDIQCLKEDVIKLEQERDEYKAALVQIHCNGGVCSEGEEEIANSCPVCIAEAVLADNPVSIYNEIQAKAIEGAIKAVEDMESGSSAYDHYNHALYDIQMYADELRESK